MVHGASIDQSEFRYLTATEAGTACHTWDLSICGVSNGSEHGYAFQCVIMVRRDVE